MAVTTNKGYLLMTTGSESGTWGTKLNDEDFTIIDSNLGGTITKTLASSPVTLSASEAQNGIVRLIGTLGANVTVTTPCIGFFYVENATTGDFIVTLQYTGGVGGVVKPAQGMTCPIISDATNGLRFGSSGLPSGSIIDYAGPGNRWTGEFLLCDGSAVSRTTYSALFQAIGTTWGSGDGTTTFNVPDFRGRGRFGRDNMGGSSAGRITTAGTGVDGNTLATTGGAQTVTLTTANMEAHSHPVTAATATITVNNGVNVLHSSSLTTAATGSDIATFNANTGNIANVTATISGTTGNTGSSTPVNKLPPLGIVNVLIKL